MYKYKTTNQVSDTLAPNPPESGQIGDAPLIFQLRGAHGRKAGAAAITNTYTRARSSTRRPSRRHSVRAAAARAPTLAVTIGDRTIGALAMARGGRGAIRTNGNGCAAFAPAASKDVGEDGRRSGSDSTARTNRAVTADPAIVSARRFRTTRRRVFERRLSESATIVKMALASAVGAPGASETGESTDVPGADQRLWQSCAKANCHGGRND